MLKLNLSTILLTLIISYSNSSYAIDDNNPLLDIPCLGLFCNEPSKEETPGNIHSKSLEIHHVD